MITDHREMGGTIITDMKIFTDRRGRIITDR